MTNEVLAQFDQKPIAMPDTGNDCSKIEHLLNEYASRLKKQFWRYRFYANNRQIPEMICQYLGKMLTENEVK